MHYNLINNKNRINNYSNMINKKMIYKIRDLII